MSENGENFSENLLKRAGWMSQQVLRSGRTCAEVKQRSSRGQAGSRFCSVTDLDLFLQLRLTRKKLWLLILSAFAKTVCPQFYLRNGLKSSSLGESKGMTTCGLTTCEYC